MSRLSYRAGFLLTLCGALWGGVELPAQEAGPNVAGRPRFRALAPGVETRVDPQKMVNEKFSRHDIPALLEVDPGFDFARDVVFRHDIWNLEFHFKPLRYTLADVPKPDGGLEPKLVTYLVYRVSNEGPAPVRFIPKFTLVLHDLDKSYPAELLATAVPVIRQREDRARALANTVEITGEIAPGEERWGVVTWQDIDLRSDRFSVYVAGLTNAYRWRDGADGSRKLFAKTLRLNFWRPGDELNEHESEIRLGGPGELDYTWVYR